MIMLLAMVNNREGSNVRTSCFSCLIYFGRKYVMRWDVN